MSIASIAGRQRGPERRVIAVADLVIVLEHAAERV
jgi:hypothetical protein